MSFDVESLVGKLHLLDSSCELQVTETSTEHCAFWVSSQRVAGYRAIVEVSSVGDHRVAYLDVYPESVLPAMNLRPRHGFLSGQTYRLPLAGEESRDPELIAEWLQSCFLGGRAESHGSAARS